MILYHYLNVLLFQVQLLQELVGTSRKMGAHAASTRHMTFLFQVRFVTGMDSSASSLAIPPSES